jgi:ABC-type dipeptide/oligopeptide/nickel transport system permease subunit
MAEIILNPAVVRRRRVRVGVPPVSVIVLAIIILLCVLAPLVTHYSPDDVDPTHTFAAATGQHWLGTDELGRDLFTRLLYGGRLSLMVCTGAVAIAFAVGTVWGLVAAERGGIIDEVLMRTADVTMAIPQILFALVCVAAFGASLVSLTVITGLLLAPSSARMARTVTIQETSLDYYSAAVAYGASKGRLLGREVLPNILSALMSQAVINAASAMILEASLSFVGLGVQPPQMSWGVLLQQGYNYVYNDPTYAAAPAITLLLTIFCLNAAANHVGSRKAPKVVRA